MDLAQNIVFEKKNKKKNGKGNGNWVKGTKGIKKEVKKGGKSLHR
jgi:hypothetical protein